MKTNLRDIREEQLRPAPELDNDIISAGLQLGSENYWRHEEEQKVKMQATIDTLKWVIELIIKEGKGE